MYSRAVWRSSSSRFRVVLICISIDDGCILRTLCPPKFWAKSSWSARRDTIPFQIRARQSAQIRRLTHRAGSPGLTTEQRQRFMGDLEERMRKAARKFEFEKAAALRDRVKTLKMGAG